MSRKDCLLSPAGGRGRGRDQVLNYSFLILTPDGSKLTIA